MRQRCPNVNRAFESRRHTYHPSIAFTIEPLPGGGAGQVGEGWQKDGPAARIEVASLSVNL